MAFPVIGGTQESGYEIDNSLRFNDDDSAYLSRTPSSASNRKTWTWSGWVKLSEINSWNTIFSAGTDSNNKTRVKLDDNGGRLFFDNETSGSSNQRFYTSQLQRDPSAWYHLVFSIDTTQATSTNRVKIYINGEQVTSFDQSNYPAQNLEYYLNTTNTHYLGRQIGGSDYWDGYLAEVNFIDGQQLTPSSFGETDDNGVWIPKNYTGSYGTNGFKLEFKQLGTAADATSIGADTSGNDNHFSQTNVTPAVDRTTDTPTNNFCTFNPLKERPGEGYATFSEGNCKAGGTSLFAYSSFVLPSSGKWYAEFKATAGTSTAYVALLDEDDYTTDGNTNRLFYRNDGQKDTGSGASSYGNSWTTNDIISIAANVDDSEVTFYKNGVAQDSGTAISQTCANQYIIVATAGGWNFEANFGNAPFSISSGNSDANGYGNFEYAVPSGYYALCTKNLAEYG